MAENLDSASDSSPRRSVMSRLSAWWFGEDADPKDKRLVAKLDAFVLVFVCCDFIVKYLDQTNITNAYISGMKEDLMLTGDMLNWLTTIFNIGIIAGGPFGTWMITVIRPRYLLPCQIIVWSVLVVCLHVCKNIQQLYAVRFLIGLVEAGSLPACFYFLGCWYTEFEINRRTQIYMASSILGAMLSGYIQGGLYKNMNGRQNLAAWQWLFIFDAIIGIPVILFGFFTLPDTPETTRVWWLREPERQRAVRRLHAEGRGSSSEYSMKKLTAENSMQAIKSCLYRILTSWQFYVYPLSWGLWEITCGTANMRYLALFLKSVRDANGESMYSVTHVNVFSAMVGLSTIGLMVISGVLLDLTKWRSAIICCLGASMVFGNAVLAGWPSSLRFKIAAYYFISAYESLGPIISARLAVNCGDDDVLRSVTTGWMLSIGYGVETPAQQYMFPASQAPQYKTAHGYALATAFAGTFTIWLLVGLPFAERYFISRSRKIS